MMPHQNVVVSDAKPGTNPAVTVAQKPPAVPRGYTPRSRRVLKDLEINGEQVINAWVDSMRASSPTNAKTTPSLAEEQYKSWILRNPSALDMFEQIVDASQGKQIVMFLDYDGTLSPIVDDPDHAYMSDSMRQTVRKLARCFTTTIVTGRCIEKANYFIRLAELYYAGCHGMDIKGPSKISKINKDKKSEEVVFQPASEFLPMINEVYQQLLEECKSTPGAIIEYNKFCTSVHYRLVDEKKWGELALKVRSVLKEYPKLCLTQGRKVFEIRPFIKWDKGMALEFLLTTLGFDNSSDVFPIYIGDDKTDEDAFKKLRDLGQGVGILVSKFPKDTIASYSLRDPNEVMDFLQRLVEWKQVRARSPVQL